MVCAFLCTEKFCFPITLFMNRRHLSATTITLRFVVLVVAQDDEFRHICWEPSIIKRISQRKTNYLKEQLKCISVLNVP